MSKSSDEKNGNGFKFWALIAALFLIGAWPIALAVLGYRFYQYQQAKRLNDGTQYTSFQDFIEHSSRREHPNMRKIKLVRPPRSKSVLAWVEKISGTILAIPGVTLTVAGIFNFLDGWWSDWLETLLPGGIFLGLGMALLAAGTKLSKRIKRCNNYLTIMCGRDAVSIDELARSSGEKPKKVLKDVQKMKEDGFFGSDAHLNMEYEYLFLNRGAVAAFINQRETEGIKQQNWEDTMSNVSTNDHQAILEKMHRANIAIHDSTLSAQIDRIEDLTSRIFRLVEAEPAKEKQLQRFYDYLLPTTQKFLDSYAQFESAGVEGENLRNAKQRIQSTMDLIVHSFEHQLDQLYQDKAMDVMTDSKVADTILKQEISSVKEIFGIDLGGEEASAGQSANASGFNYDFGADFGTQVQGSVWE